MTSLSNHHRTNDKASTIILVIPHLKLKKIY
jgi:hypothetical protein